MTVRRTDNVLIVVDDLEAAKAFFAELGMELEGETPVEGPSVDSVVGLNDVRAHIAMMRTPDGHGRVELTKFHTPPAVRAEPESAPANALGIRRIMFTVDDVGDVVARLRDRGAELVGEIAQYEDAYRLCFLRGPEDIIIGLAEQADTSMSAGGQNEIGIARMVAVRRSCTAHDTPIQRQQARHPSRTASGDEMRPFLRPAAGIDKECKPHDQAMRVPANENHAQL